MDKEKIEELLYRENLRPATITKRAIAMFIDDLLISMIIVAIIWEKLSPESGLEQMMGVANEAIVEIFLLKLIYQTIFVALYGATLGKIVTKIRVIEIATVDKPSFNASLNRALFRLVSEVAFYFGFVMAIFDPNRQALHDKTAKTIVVEYQGSNF